MVLELGNLKASSNELDETASQLDGRLETLSSFVETNANILTAGERPSPRRVEFPNQDSPRNPASPIQSKSKTCQQNRRSKNVFCELPCKKYGRQLESDLSLLNNFAKIIDNRLVGRFEEVKKKSYEQQRQQVIKLE